MCKRLAQHVGRLVNLSLIEVHREIIVHTHRSSIVQVAGHDDLLGKERCQIIITDPEKRIFDFAVTEVIFTIHNRAEGYDLAVKRRSPLIVIGTFLEVIAFHLTGGDVAVVEPDTMIRTFIEDVVVVEKLQRLHPRRIRKHLIAVHTVVIGCDAATVGPVHHQLKDIGK